MGVIQGIRILARVGWGLPSTPDLKLLNPNPIFFLEKES